MHIELVLDVLMWYISHTSLCTDVNECDGLLCHENATCTNTNGSHICECNPGFLGDGITYCNCTECTLNLYTQDHSVVVYWRTLITVSI